MVKKSNSKTRSNSSGRRSRSRTRKTNKYLLIGREKSVSQTRLISKQDAKLNGHHSSASTHKEATTPVEKPSAPEFVIKMDLISVVLYATALVLRIRNIQYPKAIVFDEQIMGSHISSYNRREMYFSFDPPLAAQFYYFIANLCGDWNKDFEFTEVGKLYPADMPYVCLRVVTVILDSLLTPLVYHILKTSKANSVSAILPALLIATDPTFIVQSRIYSGDSLSILLSLVGLYSALNFYRLNSPNCGATRWVLALSITIALSLSMKYSAVFTTLLSFSVILSKFWQNLADASYTKLMLWRQAALIILLPTLLPLLVYAGCWTVHVSTLHNAAAISSKSTLGTLSSAVELTELNVAPRPVTNGSLITLKHLHGRSCWLHSYDLMYPKRYPDGRGSSHQQQVTCYPFVDQNNRWIVLKHFTGVSGEDTADNLAIKHGDIVSLLHEQTGRLLNSHLVAAPMTSTKQEVSCYVNHNVSMDIQPGWMIDIDDRSEDTDDWLGRVSEIKLIHVNTSAALSTTSKQLPGYGADQYELIADSFIFHENTLWVADEVLPPSRAHPSQISGLSNITLLYCLEKIYILHKRIFVSVYDYSEDHEYSSSPLHWVTGHSTLLYWMHPVDNAQIYMLPNVLVWNISAFSLLALLAVQIVSNIRVRRGITPCLLSDTTTALEKHVAIGVGGYSLNLFPYFFTSQSPLLYNYLPALVFAYITFGYLVNHVTQSVQSSRWARILFYMILLQVVCTSFIFTLWISPLIYGSTDTSQLVLINRLQHLFGWRFSLNQN